jgi:sugar phosphate isomerase/epimerase
MHPRVSVNPASFPPDITLDRLIDSYVRTGAHSVGYRRATIADEGVEDAFARIAAANLRPAYLIQREFFRLKTPEAWEADRQTVRETVDWAKRLGASIYGTTGAGAAAGLTWEQACDAFVEAASPAGAYAKEQGVVLMLENSSHMFADYHFTHTLRDTIDVSHAAGFGVCVDFHSAWVDRGLDAEIARAGSTIGLVQVCDYMPGDRTMNRGIPGTGVMPLERLFSWVLETGYQGFFDLELWGDSGMDDVEAVKRGADHVGRVLEQLGV